MDSSSPARSPTDPLPGKAAEHHSSAGAAGETGVSRTINRFLRKQPWQHTAVCGPNGRKLCCCGCGREVGPRRSSSYGKECVDWWKSHSDMTHIRWQVRQRDGGVCACCSSDTEALRGKWKRQMVEWYQERQQSAIAGSAALNFRMEYWENIFRVFHDSPGFPKPPTGFPAKDRAWWEADHRIPVSEGGGGCTFNGYRTLCLPCHKRETKALAARLAAGRRIKQPELSL